MLLRISDISVLLACFLLFGFALQDERKKGRSVGKEERKVGDVTKEKKNQTVGNDKRRKASTPVEKVKEAGSQRRATGRRNDLGCTNIGGICQPNRYVCQGHYLKYKCAGAKTRQCCVPGSTAWSVLCAGHHNNRVRGCDMFGCGAFNSNSNSGLHKAVDVVCDDYGVINAPFSGSLGGPVVRRPGPDGAMQLDGVKLLNSEHCVKIFNMRPHRYLGRVSQGETLGYLLPLQDHRPGITSHLELQMCDGSDPSPFI